MVSKKDIVLYMTRLMAFFQDVRLEERLRRGGPTWCRLLEAENAINATIVPFKKAVNACATPSIA